MSAPFIPARPWVPERIYLSGLAYMDRLDTRGHYQYMRVGMGLRREDARAETYKLISEMP